MLCLYETGRFRDPGIESEGMSMLTKHSGFTGEALVFIINNDIKYRMGDELNAEE